MNKDYGLEEKLGCFNQACSRQVYISEHDGGLYERGPVEDYRITFSDDALHSKPTDNILKTIVRNHVNHNYAEAERAAVLEQYGVADKPKPVSMPPPVPANVPMVKPVRPEAYKPRVPTIPPTKGA